VTLTNVYNSVGLRTTVSDNLSTAGTISFSYDSAQRMSNVKMTVGGSIGPNVTFTYDAVSRLTNITRQVGNQMFPLPNKVLTTFTYHNGDRLTAIMLRAMARYAGFAPGLATLRKESFALARFA
jgi:hypothetical protein